MYTIYTCTLVYKAGNCCLKNNGILSLGMCMKPREASCILAPYVVYNCTVQLNDHPTPSPFTQFNIEHSQVYLRAVKQ